MLPESLRHDMEYWVSNWSELDASERYHASLRVMREYRLHRIRFPHPTVSDADQTRILARLPQKPGTLKAGNIYATTLASSYYPHFCRVRMKRWSTVEAWNLDGPLKLAIEDAFRGGLVPTPKEVRARLRFRLGEVGNFRVLAAKYPYERYVPAGGVVLDPSAGWGARQLAARSLGLHYHGIDPSEKTHECGLKLAADLDHAFEGSTTLHRIGSEEFDPYTSLTGPVDFAFTSPPYFDTEPYCSEATQSHVKFPDQGGWYLGFVLPTARMLHEAIKSGGYVAINVSAPFRDGFIRSYEVAGFRFVEELTYERSSIPGRSADKGEPILVFQKSRS